MADLVTTALQQVVTQVQEAGATLVPVGTATAGGLIIIAVLMLGAAIAGGHAAFVGPIVRLCGAAAGTLWTIATWPTIVGDTYRASLEIQARLGDAGMLGLYSMAADYYRFARVLAEGGQHDGHRLFSPRGVAYGSNPVDARFEGQAGRPKGMRFGPTVEVVADPIQVATFRSRGSFAGTGRSARAMPSRSGPTRR